MRKIQQLIIIAGAIGLILPITVFAVPPLPAIPLLVYGNVTIDGQLASIDTEITAEIDGAEVAVAAMTNQGKYFIEIPDGKSNENKTIVLKVNSIVNSDNQVACANIASTPSIKFDLTVTTPSPEPASTPSGGGGGGGGGGGSIAQAVSTPSLSGTAKAADTNGDDKLDLIDFNTLMVNWGSATANNIADVDDNGKVDIFDFNLLMIYWTG